MSKWVAVITQNQLRVPDLISTRQFGITVGCDLIHLVCMLYIHNVIIMDFLLFIVPSLSLPTYACTILQLQIQAYSHMYTQT